MRSAVLLRWTIGMAVAVAVYQATAFYHGYQTSDDFERAWSYVCPFLLAFLGNLFQWLVYAAS